MHNTCLCTIRARAYESVRQTHIHTLGSDYWLAHTHATGNQQEKKGVCIVPCSTHPYNTDTREESCACDIQHTTYFEGFTCHPQLQIYDGATLFRRPDALFTFD